MKYLMSGVAFLAGGVFKEQNELDSSVGPTHGIQVQRPSQLTLHIHLKYFIV
jgi:hypothetical protein